MRNATRTVHLAPARGGGLYVISDMGGEDAHELRVIVAPSPAEMRRARSIMRRYYPACKLDGAELIVYGIQKAKAKNEKSN